MSDLSNNLICLNGKLAALNKFINKLKELNNWVLQQKTEAEEINKKPLSEQKLATEKLHVIILFLIIYISVLYNYFNLFIFT